MKTLPEFQNLHQNQATIVCGCGESLNNLAQPERFTTIGVNDVGRKFQPNYLIVVNPRNQFSGDRFRYVETSQAEYLFTQLDLGVNHPNIVKFQLGTFGGTDFSDKNVLHYTNNSPYIALCLAILMGAKRIGLIGVDFTDHHFYAQTGRHALAPQFEAINEQYHRLAKAAESLGIGIFNLSAISRLTAFRKMPLDEFENLSPPLPDFHGKTESLKIVSYATTPIAGVPAILARCINDRTTHSARCVWATNDYGNGVNFAGDVEWQNQAQIAESLLAEADLIIVHNGKSAPEHEKLLEDKAIITMAHNYLWNVDEQFFKKGFPALVVGQYQATLPEFKDWSVVPNPIPFWETEYKSENKPEQIAICFTPFGKHETYPPEHRLYWHSKGYETTMKVLEKLAQRFPVKLEVITGRQISHAESLAMKCRSHIVIDECVTGSYHRNSLEGLAAGCVVVNNTGKLPEVEKIFLSCAKKAKKIPFVSSGLDELEMTLIELIGCGLEWLKIEGEKNRKWLKTYWNFGKQWEHFWQPVVEKSLHCLSHRKNPEFFAADEQVKLNATDNGRKNDELFNLPKENISLQGDLPMMTIAKKNDLNLPEFAAFNDGQAYPVMRRWELPFALFQMRLSGFMSVLDCTINPVNFRERLLNLYPNVVYRHHQPVLGGKFVLPSGMPDEAFDRVVCVNTLEHLLRPQREALLFELARKLKPGGFLVITCDQYDDFFWEKPELLEMGLVRADRGEVFNGFNRVTKAEIIEEVKRFGLHPVNEDSTESPTEELELHRNVEPYPHTCLAMVLSKAERPVMPKGKKIALSLLSWNTRESTLESLQAYLQEAAMLERLGCEPFVIVCDNGSTDGTPAALRKLDKKIGVPHGFIINSENKGSSIARNQIIDLFLKGGNDYLMMMDGDIEIVPFSSFAMFRYLEEQGRLLGCIGPHSSGFSPQRAQTTKYLFDLSKCRKAFVNYVAWTQYGMFRREVFADGVRFDENKPFDGEGWGFEDNDLAFQMLVKNYQIQVFTGMIYLHRNVHSSIRVMKSNGKDPRSNYESRRHYIVNKWGNTGHIPLSVINSLQQSKCPEVEMR